MHVSEGVGFLIKVFRKAGIMRMATEGFFVFLEPGGKLPTSLSDVRLVTVGASELVYP